MTRSATRGHFSRPLLPRQSSNRQRFDPGQLLRPNPIIYHYVVKMAEPPNWFFSLCSFIGFLLCMIPLPWHLEAWNTGTCLYMIWTGLDCLILFINSVVWNSDVINRAPVWCDISTKFMIGAAVAIPAASLCINRRLYYIASVSSVTKTRAQKRRDVMVDLAIGLGIPVLEMCLQYIVQGHRFTIFEEIGCYPFTFNTPPAYALVFCWPVAIGLVSASYCIRTVRELAIRRAQFKEFLAANRNLSSGRYFRLMGLAGVEVLFTLPLGIWSIYLNATAEPIQPYVSWASAHYDFSAVDQVPSVVWHLNELTVISLQMSRYLVIFCALIFFSFFGFADEARKNYRLAYTSFAKRVGLTTGTMSSTGTWTANGTNPDMSYNGRSGNMPVFITQRTEKKRDSLASFSTNLSLADYGGALADVKKEKEDFSPTATSSGSISRETLPTSPVDLDAVHLPALPEATLDANDPPRYSPTSAHAV